MSPLAYPQQQYGGYIPTSVSTTTMSLADPQADDKTIKMEFNDASPMGDVSNSQWDTSAAVQYTDSGHAYQPYEHLNITAWVESNGWGMNPQYMTSSCMSPYPTTHAMPYLPTANPEMLAPHW